MSEINTKREKIWNTLYISDGGDADAAIKALSDACGLNKITAKLLYNRGYKTPAEAKRFFDNETGVIHDPFECIDMDKAVLRIEQAINLGEKILIYGDYDVDGVTSVSSLYIYLKSRGASVEYYIPSRDGEGYGLSCAAIEKFAADGIKLIVTVDTGITAYEEAKLSQELGIDMVITDHHECRDELPSAAAIVNPHRKDCPYPFKELAGVGVVFKLLSALEIKETERSGGTRDDAIKKIFNEYADLTAIGTIADVMPLVDENRIIVIYGLALINKTERKGLAALIDTSSGALNAVPAGKYTVKSKRRHVTSTYIGFGLAPRINAAGRISNASKAVELFLTDSDDKAGIIAEELCEINRKRQIEENRIAEKAYEKIEQEHDLSRERVIVLDDDGWQQGIIGIVASRVTEKYGLPSILVTFDRAGEHTFPSDNDIGKGSGRSIKGMNLVGGLNYCDDLLIKYGGHELAAGLTIERGKLDEFRRKINEYAETHISQEMLNIHIDADCELEVSDIRLDVAEEISRLEPFGTANPTPAFIARQMKIERIYPLSSGKHIKLILSSDGNTVVGMFFGMQPTRFAFCEGDVVDVLFNLDINDFQNVKTVQMIIKDIRECKEYAEEKQKELFRYTYIKEGGEFDDYDEIVPTRDDFASVFNVIRREFRAGRDTLNEKTLLSMLRGDSNGCGRIGYVKMKFILNVFRELNVCGVEELQDGYYHFEIFYNASKTNLEKSYILKKLRAQCTNKKDK